MKNNKYDRKNSLLALTKRAILSKLKKILEQFWLPPHLQKPLVEDIIKNCIGNNLKEIVISGETENLSIYIIGPSNILVITPFSDINKNILLKEVYSRPFKPINKHWHLFSLDESLIKRLTLPKVLLINPCIIDNFPVPRLPLNVSLLASYIRKLQKADVYIIDMQDGTRINEIKKFALELQPNLVGISISYGQKWLALELVDMLYKLKYTNEFNPTVVLGNVIPASFPTEFLDLYPDLIIATREGELSISGLISFLNQEKKLADIPDIIYLSSNGRLQYTHTESVPIENIPLPALDTLPSLIQNRGALTLELSRGCQWNVCTFCTRDHKAKSWKTFTPEQVLKQFDLINKVCEHHKIKKHVFFADEEFIGGSDDCMETNRIINISQSLVEKNYNIKFDAMSRVDQVYNPRLDQNWHLSRIKMWHMCHQAGLDRLFLGVESGSRSQLQRMGKGISPQDSIIAIRILSALGIPLRFGFITFDQLMIGLNDLKENILFLETRNAFMKKIDINNFGYKALFNLLINDQDFINEHNADVPIFTGVSYMLATMEVLINSRYLIMLNQAQQNHAKTLIVDITKPDTNMGRHRVYFLDDIIADISVSCQKWIDRNFALAYCVKSLYKVAPLHERIYLSNWMVSYRKISFWLLKILIYLFDNGIDENVSFSQLIANIPEIELTFYIRTLRAKYWTNSIRNMSSYRKSIIEECMNQLENYIVSENSYLLNSLINKKLTDTFDNKLFKVLQAWRENMSTWELINNPEFAYSSK